MIKIIDLDGCISDDRWRHQYIGSTDMNPAERWRVYHENMGGDSLINSSEVGPEWHAYDRRLVVFTARPVDYRELTVAWLRINRITPLHIIMRNNHDHRPAIDVKRQMIGWLPDLYGVPIDEVVEAIDDRDDVVAMYRSCGIDARVVRAE